MITDMYHIAEREGITVCFVDFEPPLDGLYACDRNNTPGIAIAKRLLANKPLLRCVFAEELGHHFTTVGNHMPRAFHSISDRAKIDKAEYKAIRWAANYLIPENDLLDALRSDLYEIWELAEHFCVTEEVVTFRLRLFGQRP